jgi:ATP-dependent RNA helicase RhlE
LAGKDVFAQAETGSGKTGAFVIPLLENYLRAGETTNTNMSYVVLSPTRELAQQTHNAFNVLGKKTGLKSVCVIGGESIKKQKDLISSGVTALIATPGRLVDLIKQKAISLSNCKAVVFDEADRLFDMGFKKDIEFILNRAPKDRQLIMLSATSNQDVLRTAYKFHSHPEELTLNTDSLMVDHVQHKIAMLSNEEKFPLLVNILRQKEDAYAIVFCNTQVQTHTTAEWLIKMGIKAQPISGKLNQNRRTQLLKDFRAKKVTVLVCTDVAARGLDFDKINLVVNYDLPQEAANYVHRIGRTGRAGAEGEAISFCAYEDCEHIEAIKVLIDDDIEQMHLEDEDFATDICPKPKIDRRSLRLKDTSSHSRNKEEPKTRLQKPSKTEKPAEKKITTPTQPQSQKKPYSGPRVDQRSLELSGYAIKDLIPQALKHFRIKDEDLLSYEVLSQESRKYIIFGARKTKYKFFLKPHYKKLLLPFFIPLLKKANLKLYLTVSFKSPKLFIHFKGDDERLLTKNNNELLKAFEHLAATFLQSKIFLSRNIKIIVQCRNTKIERDNTKSKDDKELEKKLERLARSNRKLALEKNQIVTLRPLNARERRIIHQFFQADKKIKTVSIGEGKLKKVQLVPAH